MTLSPLLAAPLAVQVHAAAALSLIPLTAIQFWRRKAGSGHRLVGWTWVALMAVAALSSFFIHSLRLIGPFSPIHILSVVTLASLVLAIRARRQRRIGRHRRIMILVTLGWAAAGMFTLLPGRLMFQVVAGG